MTVPCWAAQDDSGQQAAYSSGSPVMSLYSRYPVWRDGHVMNTVK